MKTHFNIALLLMATGSLSFAQESGIQAISAKDSSRNKFPFYVAASNKFTAIDGNFANIAEVYGGWFLNKQWLLGIGVSGLTNDLRVPDRASAAPGARLSYMYGQAGLVSEYVLHNHKPIHFAFHLFAGAGMTFQYDRFDEVEDYEEDYLETKQGRDQQIFFVAEPGVQVEFNLSRWIRLSPGVSYRAALGSDARGLPNRDLSNLSYNITLKVGRF